MGDSATAPPPPDTSMYSNGQMSLADESRAFAREQMDYGRETQEWLRSASNGFLAATMPEMEEQFAFASSLRDYFSTNILPQVGNLIDEANRYQSAEEIDRQRGKAIQDVRTTQEAARESALRNLESYGIDPSQTRYQALDRQARVSEGALSALAANNADERTRGIGRDLRAQAINIGTGLLGTANAASNTGSAVGSTGVNSAAYAANAGTNAGTSAIPFLNNAGTAYDSAAGIVDTSYGRDLDFAADQREAEGGMGGIGELAGIGLDLWMPGAGTAATQVAGKAKKAGKAEGGLVKAPGGPMDDAGIVAISNGEYVVPADVVRKLGTNHFDKMIEKETGRPRPLPSQAIPMGGR